MSTLTTSLPKHQMQALLSEQQASFEATTQSSDNKGGRSPRPQHEYLKESVAAMREHRAKLEHDRQVALAAKPAEAAWPADPITDDVELWDAPRSALVEGSPTKKSGARLPDLGCSMDDAHLRRVLKNGSACLEVMNSGYKKGCGPPLSTDTLELLQSFIASAQETVAHASGTAQ